MITAIEIENFKGIGPRQRIEFAPITLLFGANSSGKSTIIHALHYALEILAKHNCDAERTASGGDFIDLGGFRSFVHGRDLQRRVSIRLEFDLTDESLPIYGDYEPDFSIFDEGYADRVERAAVEFQIAWDRHAQAPFVARYVVDLNGERLGTLESDAGRRSTVLAELNWNHAILREADGDSAMDQQLQEAHAELVRLHDIAVQKGLRQGPAPYLAAGVLHSLVSKALGTDDFEFQPTPAWGVAGLNDALPTWGALLQPKLPSRPAPEVTAPSDTEFDREKAEGARRRQTEAAEQFAALLTQLLVGPGETLARLLAQTRYLGPLREKPSRSHEARHVSEAGRWASGLAAWDVLHAQDSAFLSATSEWLSGTDRLGAGFSLGWSEYREIPVADPLIVQLGGDHAFDDADLGYLRERLDRIPVRRRIVLVDDATAVEYQPFDVGEGISQLVPVVVALLAPAPGIVAIEQPELHIHPAVQVGIGDLLANGRADLKGPRLVETHSEHLLLRLLRRIREATDVGSQDGDVRIGTSDLSVWYVEMLDGSASVRRLHIDESGEFLDRWPRGFFEERAKELF